MQARLSPLTAGLITVLMTILISATGGSAANFPLAWDPNCNDYPTLIGYNLYYSAGSSVVADPDSADVVCISLDDPHFDPDHPGYEITGLLDGVKYYFAVSAVYEDGESDLSNEISGTKSSNVTLPDAEPTPVADTTPTTDTTPVKDTTPAENTTPTIDTTPVTDTTPITVADPVTDVTPDTDTASITDTPPATDPTPATDSPPIPDSTPNSILSTNNSNATDTGSGGGCFISTLN
jgi:hypothetical protein